MKRHAAILKGLEQHIERHHLGQRSWVTGGIGIFRVQYITAFHIDHYSGITRIGLRCRSA